MSDSLATYLQDHLAGAAFAVELIESLRTGHDSEPLGAFASALLPEIEEDRKVLEGIIDRVGKSFPSLKEGTARLLEKASHLKLKHGSGDELGTFQALETLGLGILGKHALWRALDTIAQTDSRVQGVDYAQLAAKAQAQHASVEERRIQAARIAFGNS